MTFGDLHAALEFAVEGENYHVPVVVRIYHDDRTDPSGHAYVDCPVTACAVEHTYSEDLKVKTYQLILDIENPLE